MGQQSNKPRAYSYLRFSRPEQGKGDSVRRQLDLSERYAREHGLELDETLEDRGVSAFRGKNATEGALAGFLEAVREGTIKRGSYLLVESLDRLSRQEVETALPRFLDIINTGIVIVTLADGQRYEKGKLAMTQLIISLTVMSRAHEESATKSKRLSAAWANKRANIAEKKLTAICPGWLRLSADRKSYEPIPENVRIVQRIFADCINGKGRRVIANELNDERVPPWGKGKKKGIGFHDSYVAKILATRAVLGEYQPHRLIDGKRVPEGNPIKGYFPAIIDEQTFYLAQSSGNKRRGRVGRASITSKFLFPQLCVCGECGGPVCFQDKGKEQWRYLACANTYRHVNKCDPCRRSYPEFENQFIDWLVDFDFSAGAQSAKQRKMTELAAVEEKQQESEIRLARLTEAMESSSKPVSTFVRRIETLGAEIELFKQTAAVLRSEIENVKDSTVSKNFRELAKDPENRFRLRQEIARRVERITIHFKAPDYWPDSDPFAWIELKDGTKYQIVDGENVTIYEQGKRYTSERTDPEWESDA